MSQPNRSGGPFERYVIDAAHVQLTAWLAAFVALLLVAPVGLFYLGALSFSCVHRRPAPNVEDRRSGWRVIGRVTAIVAIIVGVLILLFLWWAIVVA